MTVAALLSRDTALADVRRRPKELHQYRDTLPDALILRTKVSAPALRKITDRMLHDLTTFDSAAGGRVIPACAGLPGLRDVLVLIWQGHRRISLAEVAAICGVHQSTAQNHMAALRDAGILRAPEIGRKGESITRYELGPVGAVMLREAHDWWDRTKARWAQWRANMQARKASRRSEDQHAKKPHRVSPPIIRTDPTVLVTVPSPSPSPVEPALPAVERCAHGKLWCLECQTGRRQPATKRHHYPT
jgi:DNA-binding transcriptional ArsR family regulator